MMGDVWRYQQRKPPTKKRKQKPQNKPKYAASKEAELTRMIKKAREDGTFDSLPDDIKAKCLKHEAKREKAAYFYNQWKEKQAYAARREEVAGIDELSLQHFKSI
ncbi:hypothetical protein [Escherichia coli]|uniref:hypothetical protein n=1 Tax=Escherichia coli TaxID=562 RepID=UPI00201B31BE|nr:hypothetical protein [Escherichia coli]